MSEEPEGEGGPESSIESKVAKRTLVRAQEYLWVTRVIPYEISPEIGKAVGVNFPHSWSHIPSII